MNKAILFLNGLVPNQIPNLNPYNAIYCTDGAYTYLSKLNIQPDVITGDFDSMHTNEFPDGIEIIETPDQNFTDFEKALQIIYTRNFDSVDVYGSSGMEHDHFLGNLTAGLKFQNKLGIQFFDDYSCYFFAEKQTKLDGFIGRTISLYPFPVTMGVKTEGLKYPLNHEDLDLTSRIGTRNKAITDEVTIEFTDGNLLIFIKNE